MRTRYVMALDQGTTSSRAVLFDRQGQVVSKAALPIRQIYPKPGWVEHDPVEIFETVVASAKQALDEADADVKDIACIGITNQRETTVLWDRQTGNPVHNAIVWQCRRTAEICERLKQRGLAGTISEKTGLVPDAYFSGPKITWLLENVAGLREQADEGKLAFGTIDTWLIYNLTGGKRHLTDVSNASRTMLFDISSRSWDDELLAALDVPRDMPPSVLGSSAEFGSTAPDRFLEGEIPVTGVIGDQQGALFGQTCFDPGDVKITYGTGCFLLMNTGEERRYSDSGLLSTIAWGLDDTVHYALEGSVFMGGAVVQWLRDELKLIKTAEESETVAQSLEDNGGVYLVPAFTGLGAPHWDMYARGILCGLTRGTGRAHIVRAGLESIAYQCEEVIRCMEKDAGCAIESLRVDGGAAANSFLMQFQSDVLRIPVVVPENRETTALGAAMLAGLQTGFWSGTDELKKIWQLDREYAPQIDDARRESLLTDWHRAVDRAKGWLNPTDAA
jgi:glycerol kinase